MGKSNSKILFPDVSAGKTPEPRHKALPRGKPYPKGHPGGPGRGHKKAAAEIGTQIERDMRLAYETPPSPSDSAAVKNYRKMYLEDGWKFTALYAKVAQYRPQEDEDEVGECEARAEELIDSLLSEWNGKLRDFLERFDGPNAVAEGEAGPEAKAPEGGRAEQAARHDAGDRRAPE